MPNLTDAERREIEEACKNICPACKGAGGIPAGQWDGEGPEPQIQPCDLCDTSGRTCADKDTISCDPARIAAFVARKVAEERVKIPTAWPEKLDSDLNEILGMLCFQAGPIARLFRDSGRYIPRAAEAEQAFVIHWLIKIWFEHGMNWRMVAENKLQELAARHPGRGVTK